MFDTRGLLSLCYHVSCSWTADPRACSYLLAGDGLEWAEWRDVGAELTTVTTKTQSITLWLSPLLFINN